MINIQLSYHLTKRWFSKGTISVLGKVFSGNEVIREDAFTNLFSSVESETQFLETVKKINGHFAVIVETKDNYFLAADSIRTFPLFIRKEENNIILADNIVVQQEQWNTEAEKEFLKTYCTLEHKTLLKNWQQLQAAEYAVIDKTNLSVKIKAYYHHAAKESHSSPDIQTAETQLVHTILQYANNRTILIPLSGGYDSRYLLALLLDKGYSNIVCYTYGKKDSYEVLIAKNVCEKLNVKWLFIEYSNELLRSFFSESWKAYSDMNHHFSSLPHEQDFFALHYLKEHNLLPENAVVMNGFCQDIHAGSFLEPVKDFDLQKFIAYKHQLKIHTLHYEHSWNGYQEWLVKNRLSKFIVNSVRVYEFFGLDFYLPFWNTEWVNFWYALPYEERLHQHFYQQHLFNGIFKRYKIDFKKPDAPTSGRFYTLKKIGKTILPSRVTKLWQQQNNKDLSKDYNNSLFLYDEIYKQLKTKPDDKDFRINNIHALYLLQNLKEKYQF